MTIGTLSRTLLIRAWTHKPVWSNAAGNVRYSTPRFADSTRTSPEVREGAQDRTFRPAALRQSDLARRRISNRAGGRLSRIRLLTGWSLVRIRPGEPNKCLICRPVREKPAKKKPWQRLWQQLTNFAEAIPALSSRTAPLFSMSGHAPTPPPTFAFSS
jgi:hypothetical protein